MPVAADQPAWREAHRAARPVAIPETGAVKRNNVTLSLSREVEQPAQFEILSGNDIAMEKDDRPSTAPLEVVKSDTVDSNEPPTRWMLPLYFSCSIGVPERHPSHGSGHRSFSGCGTIVRRNIRLGRTLPIRRGSGTVPRLFDHPTRASGSALRTLASAD